MRWAPSDSTIWTYWQRNNLNECYFGLLIWWDRARELQLFWNPTVYEEHKPASHPCATWVCKENSQKHSGWTQVQNNRQNLGGKKWKNTRVIVFQLRVKEKAFSVHLCWRTPGWSFLYRWSSLVSLCVVHISSSYEDTSQIGLGPTYKASYKCNHLF